MSSDGTQKDHKKTLSRSSKFIHYISKSKTVIIFTSKLLGFTLHTNQDQTKSWNQVKLSSNYLWCYSSIHVNHFGPKCYDRLNTETNKNRSLIFNMKWLHKTQDKPRSPKGLIGRGRTMPQRENIFSFSTPEDPLNFCVGVPQKINPKPTHIAKYFFITISEGSFAAW